MRPWPELGGNAETDLPIAGERARYAITRAVPLLPDPLRLMLRDKVSQRTLWTLALYLGAWAYRNRYVRFQRLLSSVPALSAFLNQSGAFDAFAKALVTAEDGAKMAEASRLFAQAAGSLDPALLLSVLRAPVWQRLEAQLAGIPIPVVADSIEEAPRTPPAPPAADRPKVSARRTRARQFDLPIYYAGMRARTAEEPTTAPDEIRDLSSHTVTAPLTDDARDARSVQRDGRNLLLDLGPIGKNTSAKEAIAHLKRLGYSENEIDDLLLGPNGGKSA